jgi:hypothetical protein
MAPRGRSGQPGSIPVQRSSVSPLALRYRLFWKPLSVTRSFYFSLHQSAELPLQHRLPHSLLSTTLDIYRTDRHAYSPLPDARTPPTLSLYPYATVSPLPGLQVPMQPSLG